MFSHHLNGHGSKTLAPEDVEIREGAKANSKLKAATGSRMKKATASGKGAADKKKEALAGKEEQVANNRAAAAATKPAVMKKAKVKKDL